MFIKLIIILIFFSTLTEKTFGQNNICKTEIDSITKELVYVSTEIEAKIEGGKKILIKKLEKEISLSAIKDIENYTAATLVAFIVDTSGNIKAGRIIKGKKKIGEQMLDIIKSLKWIPAICNNRKVPMICTWPLILDPTED